MPYKRERRVFLYVLIAVVAFALGMAPVYYDFLGRYVFTPVWKLEAKVAETGYRFSQAVQCFSYTASVDIKQEHGKVVIGKGAYTYGYITGVRWLGNIKEFYVNVATSVPENTDSVVVLSEPFGMIGKIKGCKGTGCWVRSIWDKRIRVPVFLKPSGYIGWLYWKDGKLMFSSIAAPLAPIPPKQVVYWLGNPDVKVGLTTTTLTVNEADVKAFVSHMAYQPVFVYTEVLDSGH